MYTFTAVGLHCLCICEGTEKQRTPENPCGMEAQEARRNPLGSQASSDPFSFRKGKRNYRPRRVPEKQHCRKSQVFPPAQLRSNRRHTSTGTARRDSEMGQPLGHRPCPPHSFPPLKLFLQSGFQSSRRPQFSRSR